MPLRVNGQSNFLTPDQDPLSDIGGGPMSQVAQSGLGNLPTSAAPTFAASQLNTPTTPDAGGPTSGGESQSSQSPRERQPDGDSQALSTPDVQRATAQPPGGGSQATPPQPDSPTPQVSLPPVPFTPVPPAAPMGAEAVPQVDQQPQVSRVVPGGTSQPSNLFGKAGGLLSGGLGIPGVLSSPQSDDTSPLLQALKQLMGQ